MHVTLSGKPLHSHYIVIKRAEKGGAINYFEQKPPQKYEYLNDQNTY